MYIHIGLICISKKSLYECFYSVNVNTFKLWHHQSYYNYSAAFVYVSSFSSLELAVQSALQLRFLQQNKKPYYSSEGKKRKILLLNKFMLNKRTNKIMLTNIFSSNSFIFHKSFNKGLHFHFEKIFF